MMGGQHCPGCGKDTGCLAGQCPDCRRRDRVQRAIAFADPGMKPLLRPSTPFIDMALFCTSLDLLEWDVVFEEGEPVYRKSQIKPEREPVFHEGAD